MCGWLSREAQSGAELDSTQRRRKMNSSTPQRTVASMVCPEGHASDVMPEAVSGRRRPTRDFNVLAQMAASNSDEMRGSRCLP